MYTHLWSSLPGFAFDMSYKRNNQMLYKNHYNHRFRTLAFPLVIESNCLKAIVLNAGCMYIQPIGYVTPIFFSSLAPPFEEKRLQFRFELYDKKNYVTPIVTNRLSSVTLHSHVACLQWDSTGRCSIPNPQSIHGSRYIYTLTHIHTRARARVLLSYYLG